MRKRDQGAIRHHQMLAEIASGGFERERTGSSAEIVIPDSVTSIGWDAFRGCTGLTNIYYTGTEAEWKAIEKGIDWNRNAGDYTIHYEYVPEE